MPIRHDYLGNPVTVDSDAALSAIDDFVGGLLGYQTRALAVLDAAAAEPQNGLANAYAGALVLLGEQPSSPADALPYLRQAEAAVPLLTERERGFVEFLKLWHADDIPAALRVGEELIGRFPRDLALLKLCHYLCFNRGDAAGMLRLALSVLPSSADVAETHGMLAFAFEQCHLMRDAEAAARTALDLSAKEPWAQHALAHVMLTEGRIDEGSQFLEVAKGGWIGLNSFMSTHLWWHQALFKLSQGEISQVLAIYDTKCWGIEPSYSQDQIGAVSLLARIELAGGAVGDRWQALAPYLALRAHDTVQPFLSLQYLYGLARAGRREAHELLASIETRAATAPEHARDVWRRVALPAASALLAHAEGRFEAAATGLETALPRLAAIGGSHAQRDLFEQIHLDVLARTGRWSAAQQILELRRRHDPDGVPINQHLAVAYELLGLPVQAVEARSRARATAGRHHR
jgi:predicted Zn-dependent protease